MEMLAHVEALLGRHTRLQPLLEGGWTLDLSCGDEAIRVVGTAPGGGRQLSAALETPRWWLLSRSGRALAIAEELATALISEAEDTP